MRVFCSSIADFQHKLDTNLLFQELWQQYALVVGASVSPSEENSWKVSLPRLAAALRIANLPQDIFISLEERVPYYAKRIDVVLFGHDMTGQANMILIELKAWTRIELSEGGNVLVRMRNGLVEEAHPSEQVRGYHDHLLDFCRAFHTQNPIQLFSCAYGHDYVAETDKPGLLEPQFDVCRSTSPIFTANDTQELAFFLKGKLSGGDGKTVIDSFDNAGVGFSKQLIEHVGEMVSRQNVFTLLDEQIAVNNSILAAVKQSIGLKRKQIIVVNGGPGTGKSVIALNALGEVLRKNKSAYLVSGSAAFTHSMRKLLGKRLDGLIRFTDFFWDKPNIADVLIVDEAHRIREKSLPRVSANLRPTISQLEELINAAKVIIVFADENQIISPKEVGSIDFFRDTAQKNKISYKEFQLTSQFRCSGSDVYLKWLDNMLKLSNKAQDIKLSVPTGFNFKVVDSPHLLLEEVKRLNCQTPNSARLLAGWCWKWSDPDAGGSLINDIEIGDFKFPWEAKNSSKPAPGIPQAKWWAIDPAGVNQAGTVYSVQGFEANHVGVIIGPDLVIRNGVWKAQPRQNFSNDLRCISEDRALPYIKKIYRTLLSRGMHSCSIFCVDNETRRYIDSTITSSKIDYLGC